MHLCADTSGDTCSLPAVQFPSLTRNQSFLIYQRGFVSWRLMPAPIRGRKQHNSSEKARANPCSDAIITHNQIRADLNRHRTQNHIKGNSMCMALHCSQSPLFLFLLLFPSLSLWLSYSISSCPSFYLSSSTPPRNFSMLVTWKICCQWLIRFLPLLWADHLFSVVVLPATLSPGTHSVSPSCLRYGAQAFLSEKYGF